MGVAKSLTWFARGSWRSLARVARRETKCTSTRQNRNSPFLYLALTLPHHDRRPTPKARRLASNYSNHRHRSPHRRLHLGRTCASRPSHDGGARGTKGTKSASTAASHKAHVVSALVTAGTITTAQGVTVNAAIKASTAPRSTTDAERRTKYTAIMAPLVANAAITQAQFDALVNAIVVDDRLLEVLSGTEIGGVRLSTPSVGSQQRSRGITGFREHARRDASMVR